MPVSLICPECDARVNGPDAIIGKRVRCPQCHSPFVARVPKTVVKELPFDSAPRPQSLEPPAANKRLPRWVWVLGGVSIVVVSFAAVLLLPRPSSRSTRPTGPVTPRVLHPSSVPWVPYRGKGFEVDLPGEPSPAKTPHRIPTLDQTTLELKVGYFRYYVHTRPHPSPMNPGAELWQLADGITQAVFAVQSASRKTLIVAGNPAIQLKVETVSAHGLLRLIPIGSMLLILAVESPDDLDETRPEVSRFFQSFKPTAAR
ncbi:TIGR03067 domain-containing protein [Limnoglobus roseus]|uniref:TIGR03067 domain-containing protein n=1 Tax=Limnoglobus roseus TaxID=2598579 RepID=A0A5C1ANE7_9BACT|nr:TIGR03067 domain-containing protein [Limnoglobus roseus]